MENLELDKIRKRFRGKANVDWEEARKNMFGMFMYRLGFVRRRDYDDLVGRYERLYRRYVGKRMEMDHIVQNCVIGDADKYELVERAREAGAA